MKNKATKTLPAAHKPHASAIHKVAQPRKAHMAINKQAISTYYTAKGGNITQTNHFKATPAYMKGEILALNDIAAALCKTVGLDPLKILSDAAKAPAAGPDQSSADAAAAKAAADKAAADKAAADKAAADAAAATATPAGDGPLG